jgi:serine/threonine protein phosphatase PrpC
MVPDDPNSPFHIQLNSHIIQNPQDVREFHCEPQPRKRTNHERLEELETHQLGSNFSLPTLSKQNITTNAAHQNDNRQQGLSHKQMKLGNILNTRPDLRSHAMMDIHGG